MNTNYNFSRFKSIGGGSKTKFYSGQKFKHFTSICPMNDVTSTNYSGQGETLLIMNKPFSNIDEADWQKEFNKVSNMFEIAEVSDEEFGSLSETSSNNEDANKNEGNYPTVKHIKNLPKFKLVNDSQYLEIYNENIENELKNITNKERKITINNKALKEERRIK